MRTVRGIFAGWDRAFYKQIFTIAVPIMLQQLINTALYLIDSVMVGGLGEVALAALGAANQTAVMLDTVIFGITAGAAVFVSQYWGKRDRDGISSMLGLSLTLCMAASVLFLVVSRFYAPVLVGIFAHGQDVIEEGTRFLSVAAYGFPFKAVIMVYSMVNRCTGKAVMPMLSGLGGLLVTGVLNYGLIYGNLGLPALGVKGAAIATIVGSAVNTVALLAFSSAKGNAARGGFRRLFHGCFKNFLYRMSIIGPVLLNDVIWGIGAVLLSVIYGMMGTQTLAALTIFGTMDKFTFVVLISLGHACSVTLGNHIGAGEIERAKADSKRYRELTVLLGFILGALIIGIGLFLPDLYNVTDEVRRLATGTIIAMGAAIWLIGMNFTVVIGTLRGGGDTLAAAVIDLVPVFFIQIPLLALLGLHFKLPLYLAYLAIVPAEAARLFAAMLRMKKGKWLRNVTTVGDTARL
ncbi:MAG: MATE family efflux transporter [Bacillota bacterium]